MRTYEVAFITAPNVVEDDLNKLWTQLETIVKERGGQVTKVDPWGRRKLAYPIDKYEEGIYTILYLEGSGLEIAEVERRLRVTDFVIRYLTIRTDEDLKRAEKMKAKRKTVAGSDTPRNQDDDEAGDDLSDDLD
ncbi:MAG: 30S ribosomal protein S6 [Blastocatellia bacterium]